MPLSLYAATVPSFLQIVASTADLIAQAEALRTDRAMAPADLLEAKLADDMLPFAYQVKSVGVHSLGAIEGVRRGLFLPDMSALATSFDGLREQLAAAKSGLEAVTVEEMEGFIGRDVAFVMGDFRLNFLAEEFLLSFSQPNFYFHAAAAYAILRARGAPIGKRHFMGPMRTKR